MTYTIPYQDLGSPVDVEALHAELEAALLGGEASATCVGVIHDADPMHCPPDSAIKVELSAEPSEADRSAVDAAVTSHLFL